MLTPSNLFSNAVIAVRSNKYSLNQSRIKSMISAVTAADAAKILTECDYDANIILQFPERDDLIIDSERTKTFKTFKEHCSDSALLYCVEAKYNYHNAKVLYGQKIGIEDNAEALYLFAIQTINTGLPKNLNDAVTALDRMGTRSAADISNIIEHALYTDISVKLKKIHCRHIQKYFRTEIDLLNIRTYFKCRIYKMPADKMFISGGFLHEERLKPILTADLRTLASDFGDYGTVVASAAKTLQNDDSFLGFEDAAADYLYKLAAADKDNSFSPMPLFHWYLVKQEELKAVKIILMGKRFGFSREKIRDNLRGLYERFS